MARISDAGSSNADALKIPGEGVATFPGMSSSTSGSRPDKNGSSTGTDRQSPVQGAESHSRPDQPLRPPSSSVSMTDGSGQETGSVQVSLQDSSGVSAVPTPVTAVPDHDSKLDEPGTAGYEYARSQATEMVSMAHQAYSEGDLDTADEFLNEAEKLDVTMLDEIASYRSEVEKARSGKGTSSETPSAGGFLVF